MVTEIVKMVDGQIEHIRIWVPRETLISGSGAIYFGQAWADSDIEYVRTETKQPAVTVHYCNSCGSRDVVTQYSKQVISSDTPNTRQRAEWAALKICQEFGLVEKYTLQAVAEMIVAEFDND